MANASAEPRGPITAMFHVREERSPTDGWPRWLGDWFGFFS
jgi:hypothetical protein